MPRLTRILAAALVLIGGAIHFGLWRTGYRHIPVVGTLFLANVGASVLIAGALVFRRDILVPLAAAGLAVGSLIGLTASRTVGLFGFMEVGLTHAALQTIAAEVGVLVTVGQLLATTRHPRPGLRLAHAHS
ncbi:MAG: hypothetical protein ACYDAD_09040 [Acidimicrobiales bacterium]